MRVSSGAAAVVSDVLAASLALALGLWTWTLTAGVGLSWAVMLGHLTWAWFVPIWAMTVWILADQRWPQRLRPMVWCRIEAALWLLAGYLVVFFWSGTDRLPRILAVYVLWDAIWCSIGVRALVLWLARPGTAGRRIAVVGTGSGRDTATALLRERFGSGEAHVAYVSTPSDVREGVTDIVVIRPDDLSRESLTLLVTWQARGVSVVTLSRLYEEVHSRIPIHHVERDWVVTHLCSGSGLRDRSLLAKRALDLAGACLLLFVGALPALAAVVCIAIDTGFPILYSQVRLGKGGRPFRLVKFRTMRLDAERLGPQWSSSGDSRVTRTGRFLRAIHLDEWPNLFAVLRGDMSLVGPRPERPEFIALLESSVPLYRARLAVLPGLTGWAQVCAGYGHSVEEQATKLEYDLYYAVHQSIVLDVGILIMTVRKVLRGVR